MSEARFVPLPGYEEWPADEMLRRARAFELDVKRRRSVRDFSERPVARELIEACLRAAGSAPSGANRQPWHFSVVADPAVKSAIRAAAEQEERRFYAERAPGDWLEALAPLGTDEHKPYLERAPCLIAIFAEAHGFTADGRRVKNYYVQESVGIAVGFLLAALHLAGLATLTHTPSPMAFLGPVLGRPAHERPYLLIPVGYPAPDAHVPDLEKKTLDEVREIV